MYLFDKELQFYHIKNLQSTKTRHVRTARQQLFYHIKNLQSTKTGEVMA